jgi:hypothetical protein
MATAVPFRYSLFRLILDKVSKRMRAMRMNNFLRLMKVREGTSLLDLGGQPVFWDEVSFPMRLTLLNLEGITDRQASHHCITYLEGDACNIDGAIDPATVDLVFSNSVIEHVGDETRRKMFASEIARLGKPYWVQTPSRWFPIEAHCGMPFWWFYPSAVRRFMLERWRCQLPAWTEMVETTTYVTKDELQRLFPNGDVITERMFGLPKSYIAYSAVT